MVRMKYIIILLVLGLSGCKKDNSEKSFCNVDNPFVELSWLKNIVDSTHNNQSCQVKIYKCIYEKQEGFRINLCTQNSDTLTRFYDCSGNVLCSFSDDFRYSTCPDYGELIEMALIFSDTIVPKINETNFCQVKNPLTDLPWLKKMTSGHEYDHSSVKKIIYKCVFNGLDGFLISWTSASGIETYTQFLDCSGNVLCHFGGTDNLNTCPDFNQQTTYRKLIWKNK
jgi:hypothetical protein